MIGHRSISSKTLCVPLCVRCVSFGARNTTFKEGMSVVGWPTFSHPRQVTCSSFQSLFLLFLFASDIIIWWWLLPAHLSCKANRACLTWISFFHFLFQKKEPTLLAWMSFFVLVVEFEWFHSSHLTRLTDKPVQCPLLTDYRSTCHWRCKFQPNARFNSIRLKRLKLQLVKGYRKTRGNARYCRIFSL
jgi:hypothetical protein